MPPKRKTDNHTVERTERGFGMYGEFASLWHGTVQVYESSVAFRGACVWVRADVAYGDKDAPVLHLSYADAKALRDKLNVFIAAADAGETCEPPPEGA